MLIKICGIKNIKSAKVAVESGADLLGFIFVPGTKRYIPPKQAKKLIKEVRNIASVQIAGVFRDDALHNVNQIAEELHLDYVQLHGSETPEYVDQVKAKVIKAFNLISNFDVNKLQEQLKSYPAEFFLLDRERVGEGEMLDLKKIQQITAHFPVILSGGLNPENIGHVLTQADPTGVDVSSGVETDGEKDLNKITKFLQTVKERVGE